MAIEVTWTEMIKTGMELIRLGCERNTSWTDCKNCPFNDFCDTIMEDYDGEIPSVLFKP